MKPVASATDHPGCLVSRYERQTGFTPHAIDTLKLLRYKQCNCEHVQIHIAKREEA